MKSRFPYLLLRLLGSLDRYRFLVSLVLTGLAVWCVHAVFSAYLSTPNGQSLLQSLGDASEEGEVDTGFSPEVLLALLTLVLGTLIIVVSIASQNVPKLIDLYLRDWVSLFYIWFITITLVIGVWTQLYASEAAAEAVSATALLNTFVLLPLGGFLAVPYIYYVFRNTKPRNVIQRIHAENVRRIRRSRYEIVRAAMEQPSVAGAYQQKLFESLNQLSDLLEYTPYKEPRSDIIRKIGEAVRLYVTIKPSASPKLFAMTPELGSDISFRTMTDQLADVESTRTFYEQKCFRLVGDAYQKLLERDEFDLATLCTAELADVGRVAIEVKDEPVVDLVTIRFNTVLRFGIKHGLKHRELRNLHNAIFHYGKFIEDLVEHRRTSQVKRCCRYLQMYSAEIYNHSAEFPAFEFLVAVFGVEMNKILIRLSEEDWPRDFQKDVLELLLQMDRPLDFQRIREEQSPTKFGGIRAIQIALALYFLRVGKHESVDLIVGDIADPRADKSELKTSVEGICNLLANANAKFWEDTDRGSANLFFTPDKDQIPRFLESFQAKLDSMER